MGRKLASTAKDVGTSATRIVTDPALDVGNVATGFRFDDQLAHAKGKMSEAGIRSAAEAIRAQKEAALEADIVREVERLLSDFDALFADRTHFLTAVEIEEALRRLIDELEAAEPAEVAETAA